MGLDRAPIEFQPFYFSHVCVTPPNDCESTIVKFMKMFSSGKAPENIGFLATNRDFTNIKWHFVIGSLFL